MRQQQQSAPTRKRKGGADGASAPGASPQSLLGNAALAERHGASVEGATSEVAAPTVATPTVAPAAAVDGANSFPDGEELQEPAAQQPLRPTSFRTGQKGALIGSGSTVKLAKTADGKGGKSVGEVPDGVGAEIVQVSGARLKVAVRDGKKNLEGWVDSAVFSDQPALTRDEENEKLTDDFVYSKIGGDHTPAAPKGKDTAQGFAGDCFLIASMAAVANASPGAIKDMVKYDKGKGTYTVRFYEEQGKDKYKPVYIEVDSYLPTAKDNRKDPTYAGDEGGVMWSAIIEKAYAKWKGGYDVIGEGGTGEQAMAELTGARSQNKSLSGMKEADVLPFFTQAKKDGKAIYAGVKDGKKSDAQTPFSGSGDGPFTGKVSHTHRWNEINPGTVSIKDKQGKAGEAWDTGASGDRTGKLEGSGVKSGSVDYKGETKDNLELSFAKGKGPASAKDLQVEFEYEGVIDLDRFIIANHAYAFEGVVNGKELQFYNPWGTYQPKPITPAQFLSYFDSLTTNTPPSAKTKA